MVKQIMSYCNLQITIILYVYILMPTYNYNFQNHLKIVSVKLLVFVPIFFLQIKGSGIFYMKTSRFRLLIIGLIK